MDPLEQAIEELKKELGEDVITTGSNTPRPEKAIIREAFDDFNERNPLAGGGMLVQPSADGSRPGYKNERRVLGDPITIDGKQYKKVIEGPDKGKYVIREGQNNPRQFVKKSEIKKTVKANIEKGKQNLKEMYAQRTVLNKRTTANRSKWIKNWLNKNLNKYDVREFNNFQNDLLNDFNAEVEKNPNKYGTSRKDFLLTKDGFPVYGDQRIGGEIYDGISFTRAGADRNQLLSYQKIFFKNKLKDKDFKAKVNSYLDWNLTKKVEGGAGSMAKTAALDYGKFKKGFDDDVIYLMGEVLNNKALNPGGGQIGINDIFKKSIGKKADAYFKKYQGSWTRWLNNFYEVASLAGLDKSQADALIQKQKNDSQKIMRLFNVKKLPPEFVVAQDHLFGLAEAKALGDPKIARQTLRALIATTKEQNRILGQEGFSGKRTALIRRFKNASLENKANIVNQLNTLAEEYVPGRLKYDVKKDGSLKITNLQPEPTLKSKATAYRDLAKNFPVNIKKQFALLGGGKCKTRGFLNQGGRVGLQDGTPSVDVCFGNALERIRKGGVDFTKAEAMNFDKLTKGLRAIGASNIMKFGVIPEALFEGALIANKMVSEGDSAMQGVRNSYLAIPFQKLGLMQTYDEGRREEILNPEKIREDASPLGETQKKRVKDVMSLQDTLNEKNQLLRRIQGLQGQAEDIDAISDGSDFGYVGDSQAERKKITELRADLQDMYRGDAKGNIRRAERLLTTKPMDLNINDQLIMDAYKNAVEKANALRASKIKVAPGTGLAVDRQIKKRMDQLPITSATAEQDLKATGDFFGTGYTPLSLNKLYTLMGRQDPKFGIDKVTGKYNQEQGIEDYVNYLRTLRFADNFRDEKAGGGIAGLSGGIDEGPQRISMNPDSQGLSGLLKNGNKI